MFLTLPETNSGQHLQALQASTTLTSPHALPERPVLLEATWSSDTNRRNLESLDKAIKRWQLTRSFNVADWR